MTAKVFKIQWYKSCIVGIRTALRFHRSTYDSNKVETTLWPVHSIGDSCRLALNNRLSFDIFRP